MSDELRDRIAAKLELGTSCCELCWESAKEVAQTVIEDLGLVVETTVRVVDHGAGDVRIPETRVVGKWER